MRLVVFGLNSLSDVAWYCLTHDSPHEVSAFTVDGRFVDREEHLGLPVVAFEDVDGAFPPDAYGMVLPIGARAANRLRAERYAQATEKGYTCPTYVSSRAMTWPDLQLGANTLIYDGAAVQPFSQIGNDVVVRQGASISHHGRIGDHCFLASHAVIGGNVTLGERCFIGLNAAVRDGVTVAAGCMIAAGSLVTADTIADTVYAGNPARPRRLSPAHFIK
jgi:sugar O-acyltransferase (sialic acid O-acetyltransferase NeuD family)